MPVTKDWEKYLEILLYLKACKYIRQKTLLSDYNGKYIEFH